MLSIYDELNATRVFNRDIVEEKNQEIEKLKKNLYNTNEQLKIEIFKNSNKLNIELPERYIINDGATILFWKNGRKTVVKRAKDDEFNPRLAFLTAFFQHCCGMSKNKANKYLASLEIEKKEEKQKKPKHMKERK